MHEEQGNKERCAALTRQGVRLKVSKSITIREAEKELDSAEPP